MIVGDVAPDAASDGVVRRAERRAVHGDSSSDHRSIVREIGRSGVMVGGAYFEDTRFGRLLGTEDGQRDWNVAN